MEIKRIESKFLGSNVFIVIDRKECLIIDAGVEIDKVLKEVGDNKVVGILLTHGHYDHCAYIKEYCKKFDCPVFINQNGKKTMGSKKLNYSGERSFRTNDKFVFLDEDCKIKRGHFNVCYFHTPGHSPCCACYLIKKDLFAGDTAFYVGVGRIDLLESDREEMINSLEKIEKIKFETLHSGHERDSLFEEQMRNLSAYKKFLSRK